MADLSCDVLIDDSTPSGILAAVAAAGEGLRVVMVTEDKHVGGMQTAGLGGTNAGQSATIGGLTRAFHDRVRTHYVERYGTDSRQVESSHDGVRFEPHVAESIFERWISEAGVEVVREDPVVAVEKDGARLRGVVTASGRHIEADYFIDAGYEGDLMALAGCDCHIGRESAATYGEPLAGVRWPPEEQGRGDAALQPYDFRFCLTNVAGNRVPFTKPAAYDPSRYAWHAAWLKASVPSRLYRALPLNMIPNDKTDSRTGEWVGASWKWPTASRARRREIARDHLHYSEGYVWFLLNTDTLPPGLRDELETWGYAADEFVDNGNRPYHLYVRQARRLVGDWVMTQSDVQQDRLKPDGVALGSFYLDVHPVQMRPDPDGYAGLRPEGHLGDRTIQPYEIPYRALLPKAAQAENLLATVCVSASHVAYSTIRMEPVFAMLGHAAGLAVAQALHDGGAPLHRRPCAIN